MTTITLFHNPMSRSAIARWALEEVGADYTVVPVDWNDKPDALLAANPMRKIPTIVCHAPGGDKVVSEAAAVCHYLAEMYPEAGLLPQADEKADYFRWLFFAAGPLEQAVASKALGLAPSRKQQGMLGFGNYDRTVDALDGWLSSHDYVCGDRFTMADVYVGSHLDWGLGFETLPRRDSFVAHVDRMRAREPYGRAKELDGTGGPA